MSCLVSYGSQIGKHESSLCTTTYGGILISTHLFSVLFDFNSGHIVSLDFYLSRMLLFKIRAFSKISESLRILAHLLQFPCYLVLSELVIYLIDVISDY